MSPVILKFAANFVAIIVFALAIDSQKGRLARYFVVEDVDLVDVERSIHGMNTFSLAFTSAINAYSLTEKSPRLLTVISLAYLFDLAVFWFMTKERRRKAR